MKKLFIAFMLVFSIVFSLHTSTFAENTAFTDIDTSNQNLEAVKYLKDNNIVQGYSDGTFKPKATIRRDEFLKIIIGAVFSKEEIEKCQSSPFPDVKNYWGVQFACIAKQKGIISGNSDGKFYPENNISFAESAKIIVNAFGEKVTENSSEWQKPFIDKLAEKNAIPTNIEDMEAKITRGDMAEIVWRVKEKVVNKESRKYEEMGKDRKYNQPKIIDVKKSNEDKDKYELSISSFQDPLYLCIQEDFYSKPENGECNSVMRIESAVSIIFISFKDSALMKLYLDQNKIFDEIIITKSENNNIQISKVSQLCGNVSYNKENESFTINNIRLLTTTGWSKLYDFINKNACVKGIQYQKTFRVFFIENFIKKNNQSLSINDCTFDWNTLKIGETICGMKYTEKVQVDEDHGGVAYGHLFVGKAKAKILHKKVNDEYDFRIDLENSQIPHEIGIKESYFKAETRENLQKLLNVAMVNIEGSLDIILSEVVYSKSEEALYIGRKFEVENTKKDLQLLFSMNKSTQTGELPVGEIESIAIYNSDNRIYSSNLNSNVQFIAYDDFCKIEASSGSKFTTNIRGLNEGTCHIKAVLDGIAIGNELTLSVKKGTPNTHLLFSMDKTSTPHSIEVGEIETVALHDSSNSILVSNLDVQFIATPKDICHVIPSTGGKFAVNIYGDKEGTCKIGATLNNNTLQDELTLLVKSSNQ